MFFARRYFRFLFLPLMVAILILVAAFPAAVRADDELPPPEPTPLATEAPEIAPIDEDMIDPAPDEGVTDAGAAVPLQDGVEVGISQDDQRISAEGEMSPSVLTATLPIWCPVGVEPIAGENGCTAEFGSISLLMDYLNSNSLGEQGQIWIPESNSSEAVETSSENSPAIGEGAVADEVGGAGGVNVVILDNTGNSLPLDSEEGTNALLNGQPVWCPDGIAPGDGGESCTSSSASLGLLVSMMENGSLEDGALYIQAPQSDAVVAEDISPQSQEADQLVADGQELAQAEPVVATEENSSMNVVLQDPIWCPANIGPVPSTNGCTASFLTLDALVAYLVSNEPNSDGTIWMENVTFASTTSIMIDGSVETTWANQALTFQGGWDGGGTTSSISGNTTLAQTISVVNWLNNVSVNNLVIQGGATGDGLTIQTSQNVSLDTVTSNNNSTGYGVLITTAGGTVSVNDTITNQNRVGVRVNGNGLGQTVNITNATANQNSASGVVVLSLGDINVDTSSASNNGGSGVHLANAAGSGGISIFGTGTFSGNANLNIFADSVGTISVRDSNVSSATATSGMMATTPGSIVVACSAFNNNFLYGFDASNFASLAINGDTFSANNSGDYVSAGAGTITVDLSCNPIAGGGPGGGGSGGGNGTGTTFISSGSASASSINIANLPDGNGGSSIALNCADFSGTQLNLANGDRVTYLCPTTGEASLIRLDNSEGSLPAALPGNVVFMSALQTQLTAGGVAQNLTPGNLKISFVIPVDMIGFTVGILHWDGSTWSDLSTAVLTDGRQVSNGGVKTEDGRFEATTNFPGIFVLVRK